MLQTQKFLLSFAQPLAASAQRQGHRMREEVHKSCVVALNGQHTRQSASSATVGVDSPLGGGKVVPSMEDIEYKNAKPFDSIPKDWSCTPIVGTVCTVIENLMMRNRVTEKIVKKELKYGPLIRRNLGSMEYLTLSDVDGVEKIHRFEGKYPRRLVMEPWRAWREERGLSLGIVVE